MKEVVRAGAMTGFIDLVEDLGGSVGAMLDQSGLTRDMLADPDRYIRYRSLLQAFEIAAKELGIPDFGLRLASRQDLGFLGTLALAIQSAQSLRDGLIVAARHMTFHTPDLHLIVSEPDQRGWEQVELRFAMAALPPIPQAHEHAVAHVCKVVHLLTDGRLTPDQIHFTHSQLGADERYVAHLGRVPEFCAEFSGVSIQTEKIRYRSPHRNKQLQDFVERFLIGLTPAADLSIVDQVREALGALQRAQNPSLQNVSRILRMHPRTLQRQLHDHDTSFFKINDEVRRKSVERLLGQSTIPLATVARSVGFNDQAALSRACKRWFECPPNAWRKAKR